MAVAWLVGGLALLVLGGDRLVHGASRLAATLGIPPLAIGLTVVAFGTSAPELAVNVTGALDGRTALAFGNVLGSNIANIALILGIAALCRPLVVHAEVIAREIPMALLAMVAIAVAQLDPELEGGVAALDRIDGAMLLLLFLVFLYYTAAGLARERGARRGARAGDPAPSSPTAAEGSSERISAVGVARDLGWIAFGLVGLTVGASAAVKGAVEIAVAIGLSEAVIGLTVLAVGTSLPELVSTVVAARRGAVDLAVGNIVGSNIFNSTMILGTTAVIAPVPIPAGGRLDLTVALVLTAALLVLSRTDRGLVRWEGGVLLAAYVVLVGARLLG